MKKLHNNSNLPVWNKVDSKKFLGIKSLGNFGRILLWLFSEVDSKRYIFMMLSSFTTMYKRNGSLFLIQYLKESHRLLMKAVSGHPEVCSTYPRVATRRGLPLIIPGFLRLKIEKQDTNVITLTLSIITVYRILRAPGVLKLNTITDPFWGESSTLSLHELKASLIRLGVISSNGVCTSLKKTASLLPTTKAGPNFRIGILGLSIDAYAFKKNPNLYESFKVIAGYTGPDLLTLLDSELSNLSNWLSSMKLIDRNKISNSLKLGKLSEKLEAAGKVRVFAITDVWTQSVLNPLHQLLFHHLKLLEMDGTFDQLKPLKRLTSSGHKEFYSYDLSAATDRLPIDLQCQILSLIVDETFAKHWKNLLVGRPWYLKGIPYLYSVGQPMGALSSWGMLALTHHVLVQTAAKRVGFVRLFKDYAILGDDIVIANKTVALAYLAICKEFGLDINLSKSLESQISVAEFAKRLVIGTEDVSPVPPKLVMMLLRNMNHLPLILKDMMSRGLSERTKFLVSSAENLKASILWECIGPLGFLPSAGLSPFLGDRALSEKELKTIIDATIRCVNRSISSWFFKELNESQVLIDKIGTMVWDGVWIGKGNKIPFTMDTPGFHYIMNLFIERTIEVNTNPPVLVEWPKDQPYTFETCYDFIRDSVGYLDSLAPAVPDLTEKSNPKPLNPSKMKFYKELEAELHSTDLFARYLTKT